MTQYEVWQNLRPLESFDNVKTWFYKIHGRTLSSRRASEIVCAAKQAREYFRNAKQADYSVRSLLTFYGVASLSRSVTLLLNKNNGEEVLTKGHGLEVSKWSDVLSGEISEALRKLGKLEVKTCHGLFEDFIKAIKNTTYVHTSRSKVDWAVYYDVPEIGQNITLEELLSRIPDLKLDTEALYDARCSIISELSFTRKDGLQAKCPSNVPQSLCEAYQNYGYEINEVGKEHVSIDCSVDVFCRKSPMFLHSYTDKMFASIPRLYLVEPLNCACNYCELGICYLLSYFMGMLSRYYPTHWVSLINGGPGDCLWPSINRAQNYVETVFPELIVELIQEKLKGDEKN